MLIDPRAGFGARLKTGILLGIFLTVAATTCGLAIAVRDRYITWESLLRLLPHRGGGRHVSRAESEVQEDFRRIADFVAMNYMGTHKTLPESLVELFTAEARTEFLQQGNGLIKPRLAAGIDPWGSPYVYTLRAEGGVPQSVLRIRSVGPNGRDENGAGDDMWKDIYTGTLSDIFP